ncbi:hypothetical protein R5R35_007690 [Gryllus longicercus]|uniref:Ubiquitin thioesterase OTU n=1 Tax=Gryllus longicercus TaxID=2509291 RepID=A0AAN9VPN4_9ORTH|nr:Ubiquitin thioesterase OTU1 [Gryllus bimaculatus]
MAGFALRMKSKSGQTVIKGLTPQSTVAELKGKLSSLTNIREKALHVLSGFPPKPLDLKQSDITLEAIGITSGDTLIIEERDNPGEEKQTDKESTAPQMERRIHIQESQLERPGILMRKVVPADNSCLFTSIGFVLGGKVDPTCAPFMRQIIAETVAGDSGTYSEAILGQPNHSYCEWILKPDSWGGAIELAVLSQFYGIEIAVVDTLNAIINRFGEDQRYAQRVFLVFDGIHYDPLYLEPFEGGSVQTIFLTTDERILQEAEQLALEAKSSRQYTDVHRFSLKCLVCQEMLVGQVEAQQHAKATGHKTFGETAS